MALGRAMSFQPLAFGIEAYRSHVAVEAELDAWIVNR